MSTRVEPVSFTVAEGITIRGDAYGSVNGRPVILLHGGGQTRHAWHETATALSQVGFQALPIDMRGHGQSDWAPDHDYSLDAFVADLHAILGEFDPSPSLVGASLGGITGLLAEGESADRVLDSLVLVDVAPKIETQGVAKIIAFMTARPDGFESLQDAADAVAEYLPHRSRPSDLSGLEKNLVRSAEDGRYRWHWDPAFMAGPRPPGSMGQLDRLSKAAESLDLPTLLVRGKISDLLSEAGADSFLELVPHAEFADVAGAGHMVAGDSNKAFTDAVIEFLIRTHS